MFYGGGGGRGYLSNMHAITGYVVYVHLHRILVTVTKYRFPISDRALASMVAPSV